MKPMSHYMDEKLILFLPSPASQEEVIETLVDQIAVSGLLKDKDRFYQAICEREKLVSTGIGMGVAIPHAKMGEFDQFFIAMAILGKGIDWKALDGSPVRIIFMIGGPDNRQTEYLQILSQLTLEVKNEKIRKKILTSNSKEDIIRLFG